MFNTEPIKFPREWLRNPPEWIKQLHIEQIAQSSGFDFINHSFWRTDISDDGRSYTTEIETDGSTTMRVRFPTRTPEDKPVERTLFVTGSVDDGAAHPMPLVREKSCTNASCLTEGSANTDKRMVGSGTNSVEWEQFRQRLREQYGSAKLAIETSKTNFLTEYQTRSLSDRTDYMLLDGSERDKEAIYKAKEDLGLWRLLGYSADYKKAAAETKAAAEKQMLKLKSDANTSDEARTTLAFLAISDRGLYWQSGY